jgi:hypothetical protein
MVSIEEQAQPKEMLAVRQSWSGAELSVSYPTAFWCQQELTELSNRRISVILAFANGTRCVL